MYVKLFSSLYQGTLRGRSDEILVFTNLLAHADSYGVVDKHWKAISEETGISRERVEAAILNLEAIDPDSRSPEAEGRRIIRMDEHRAWGWKIVNYGKYRAIRNEDDRREQNRLAQERFRNRHSNISKPRKPPSSQAEAEEEEEKKKARKRAVFDPLTMTLPTNLASNAWKDWVEYRVAKRKPMGLKSAAELLTFLSAQPDPNEVIKASIRNDWQGLFELKTNGAGNGKHRGHSESLAGRAEEAERRAEAVFGKL